MSYIARDGKIWSMPYGGEFLGQDATGQPLYFTGNGVSPMVLVNPRKIGRSSDPAL